MGVSQLEDMREELMRLEDSMLGGLYFIMSPGSSGGVRDPFMKELV